MKIPLMQGATGMRAAKPKARTCSILLRDIKLFTLLSIDLCMTISGEEASHAAMMGEIGIATKGDYDRIQAPNRKRKYLINEIWPP